jgi:hypothetical protein
MAGEASADHEQARAHTCAAHQHQGSTVDTVTEPRVTEGGQRVARWHGLGHQWRGAAEVHGAGSHRELHG